MSWVRNDPQWLKDMAKGRNEDGSDKDEYTAEFENRIEQPGGGYEVWETASVKWNGCVEYRRYFNAPKSEQEKKERGKKVTNWKNGSHPGNWDFEQLHICGIDSFIKTLLELDSLARTELYKYDAEAGPRSLFWAEK